MRGIVTDEQRRRGAEWGHPFHFPACALLAPRWRAKIARPLYA